MFAYLTCLNKTLDVTRAINSVKNPCNAAPAVPALPGSAASDVPTECRIKGSGLFTAFTF